MGDFMSKVREKKSMLKSGFEKKMWKIIRQFDNLGRFLNNFYNFKVFLAQKEKYPKISVIFSKIEQRILIIIYIILIVWIC